MKKLVSSIVLLVASGLTSFGGEHVATFSDLPRGDKIVVNYSSTGCFHFFTYEFTYFRDGAGAFEVAKLDMAWSEAKQTQIERSRKLLGHVSLEKGETKKIDALIAFYRHNIGGGCTTVDSIRISQIHNGRVVAEESFVDSSCATEEQPELLKFGEMASVLEKANK